MCVFDSVVYIVLGVIQFRNLCHVTHVYPFCYLSRAYLKDFNLSNQVVDKIYEFYKVLHEDIITHLGTLLRHKDV